VGGGASPVPPPSWGLPRGRRVEHMYHCPGPHVCTNVTMCPVPLTVPCQGCHTTCINQGGHTPTHTMTHSTALALIASLASLGDGMTRANACPEWMAAVRQSADRYGISQLAWLATPTAA